MEGLGLYMHCTNTRGMVNETAQPFSIGDCKKGLLAAPVPNSWKAHVRFNLKLRNLDPSQKPIGKTNVRPTSSGGFHLDGIE